MKLVAMLDYQLYIHFDKQCSMPIRRFSPQITHAFGGRGAGVLRSRSDWGSVFRTFSYLVPVCSCSVTITYRILSDYWFNYRKVGSNCRTIFSLLSDIIGLPDYPARTFARHFSEYNWKNRQTLANRFVADSPNQRAIQKAKRPLKLDMCLKVVE